MFIAEDPYVSDLLKQTLIQNHIPVLKNNAAKQMRFPETTNWIDEETAINLFNSTPTKRIYTASENALGWMNDALGFSPLPQLINTFKNKTRFRELNRELNPQFYFKEITFSSLKDFDASKLPYPIIIKPNIGFGSISVYKINSHNEWERTVQKITLDVLDQKEIYPHQVLDNSNFIIEQYISGEEYAIDAYIDSNGKAVILNILKHIFPSEDAVNDRLYTSSKKIILENLKPLTNYLNKIALQTQAVNFPLHAEVRITKGGTIFPIEINPMRFGGWCTTADLALLAYGFNPYQLYFENKHPDWDAILKGKGEKIFSVIVLDNVQGNSLLETDVFNYDQLLKSLPCKPLLLRKTDYRKYPIFGFLFMETTSSELDEMRWILNSDLKEFINT